MRVFHHWVPGRKVALFVAEGTALSAACVGGAVIASRALEPSGVPVSASAWRIVWLLALGGVAAFQYALYLVDLYDLRVAWQDRARGVRVLRAAGLAAVTLGGLGLLAGPRLPPGAALGAAVGAVTGVLLVRAALSVVTGAPVRVAVVGEGLRSQQLARWLEQDGDGRVELVSAPEGEELVGWMSRAHVRVVVDAGEPGRGALAGELLRCRLAGASVLRFDSFVERELRRLPVSALEAESLAFADELHVSPLRRAVKRGFDIAVASAMVMLAWPLAMVVGFAVALDSRGPVFYRQERVGRGGTPFLLWKFRSMRTDAERDGAVWARKDDDRVTRVGRFIRKTRMDELPQLLNVLRGEMSLVGPRPERPMFVESLKKQIPFYGLREAVKPGVTGWAQIRYPYGASVEDARNKLEYDLYYVKNGSLFLDAACLFHTVRHVLVGRGAR
jgi:exopolysaccharide biosynthesis polyprenyl glycosylphosphotransferase